MKYTCTVLSVEIFQDYGKNIVFTCGLSLQQDFAWLTYLPADGILQKSNNMEICFEEENFDDFLERLHKISNIDYLEHMIEHSWGQRVIRFYDLDGHIIEVGEDMKMVLTRFFSSGMRMEEISEKMDVSISDLTKLLNGWHGTAPVFK